MYLALLVFWLSDIPIQACRLVTDNAVPASIRLELSKLGVEIVLAKT
jgi:hypothetical protein